MNETDLVAASDASAILCTLDLHTVFRTHVQTFGPVLLTSIVDKKLVLISAKFAPQLE